MKITVVGAGGWGTALACLLVHNGHQVTLWSWLPEQTAQMLAAAENREFLPGVPLPPELQLTSDISAVGQADLVLFVSPSSVMASVVAAAAPQVRSDAIVVNAAKGLDPQTLLTMSQLIERALPDNPVCVLSGPSHAEEVARCQPTLVCVAGKNAAACKRVQTAFAARFFRVYTSDDVVGVEIGGAVKNIIALAAGILSGLQLGDNARAALMTRGLAEMQRLGQALGARPETFAGLTGMGDLIVTCTSLHSRNFRAGLQIGQGRKWREVLAETKMVVEGVSATDCIHALAAKLQVEMPITQQIYEILHEDKNPRAALWDLMERSVAGEAAASLS